MSPVLILTRGKNGSTLEFPTAQGHRETATSLKDIKCISRAISNL